MCWDVLNDEWVSHPTWASEDSIPSSAHKRNMFEEALHKTEEERHEYDYHIEANIRTIALLEPIAARIATMDPVDKEVFRLKSGLGGQSKSIYQRILKKIYGREQGLEVIAALHDQPALAVPVVLARLKQKDEEWKKAQREWNKVWREVDAKNFYKSLDHQGAVFKTNDKKAIATKTLIAEVEALRKEQSQKMAGSADPSSLVTQERGQYKFSIEDVPCLQDALRLVFTYLDRMSVAAADKTRIENFLRLFIPTFFQFQDVDFDAAFNDLQQHESDEDGSDDATSESDDDARSTTSAGRRKKNGGAADLRTKLLRQVVESGQEKRGKRADSATPSLPAPRANDDEGEDTNEILADSENTWVAVIENKKSSEKENSKKAGGSGGRKRYTFYGNNHYFCLFRLLQILYSRLKAFKEVSDGAVNMPAQCQPVNPVAKQLGLTDSAAAPLLEDGANPTAQFYSHLLDQCERLFDAEIDAGTFEESIRYMYGTKAYPSFTIDKVVNALIKHAQAILLDSKSHDLMNLLSKDRAITTDYSTRHQIAYRMAAEEVLNPDENLFKIDWIPSTKRLRILLLAKEDMTADDLETAEQKWEAYIASFAMNHPTEGLRYPVEPPLLQRTLVDMPLDARQEAQSGMGVKIALGSYRMFFVEGECFC